MRLNLYWRGWDVFDVEVHVWKRRESAPQFIGARKVTTSRPNGRAHHPVVRGFGFTSAQ